MIRRIHIRQPGGNFVASDSETDNTETEPNRAENIDTFCASLLPGDHNKHDSTNTNEPIIRSTRSAAVLRTDPIERKEPLRLLLATEMISNSHIAQKLLLL